MTSKLQLPDVTLFAIDAHNPAGLRRAADICQEGIEFGAVKIITERMFPGNTHQEGRANYSKFMIKELTKHFDTSHVLTIHADGYILRPEAWNMEWLRYSYVGATWGYKDNMNVGNGGFSLRSKRLCDILAQDDEINQFMPEDHHICRTYRPYLESKYDIYYAPEQIANLFSIEAYGSHVFDHHGIKGNLYSGQFGFHGPHVDMRNFAKYNIDPSILYRK